MSSKQQVVSQGENCLFPLDAQPPLRQYVKDLYKRRYFIWYQARARAFQATRGTVLGSIWILGQPILQALMYGTVFGLLLKTSRGIDNFIGFLIIGITFFGLMNKQLAAGSNVLQGGKALIQSFRMPTATIPVAQSLQISLDTAPAALMSVLIALVMQGGHNLTWTVLLVVPLFALIQIFGCGLMLVVARLGAFVPDTRIVLSYVSSAWFFCSGIFYSLERYADNPTLYQLLSMNPGFFYIDAVRQVTMYGNAPSASDWMMYIVVALATFATGFLIFWRGERRYRNVI